MKFTIIISNFIDFPIIIIISPLLFYFKGHLYTSILEEPKIQKLRLNFLILYLQDNYEMINLAQFCYEIISCDIDMI